MIEIYLNDKIVTTDDTSLNTVLSQTGYDHSYYAVAVNKKLISKTQHGHIHLKNGDHVDIITPMQGG